MLLVYLLKLLPHTIAILVIEVLGCLPFNFKLFELLQYDLRKSDV